MALSSATSSATQTRLNLANRALSEFLRSGSRAAGRRESNLSPTAALSSHGTPSVQSDLAGTSSLSGLLLSLATTSDSINDSRQKLGQLRDQLGTVLEVAVKARNRPIPDEKGAEIQRTIDRIIAEIARLTGDGTKGIGSTLGPNAPPTDGLGTAGSKTVGGTTTTTLVAAQPAQLYYDGNADSQEFETGTFLITGSLGTRSVTFNQGSSLAELAALVNQQTGATGVTAAVQDNQLLFRSTSTGSTTGISVGLTLNRINVSGVNSSSVAAFDVVTFEPASSNIISGTVTTAAEQAEEAYVGQNGRVTDTATLQLTGNLGTVSVSLQAGELLADAAVRINQQSSSTGVLASIDGDRLVFNSSAFGSAASVAVEVTSLEAVRGLNSNQVSDFQIESIAPNTNQAFSGELTSVSEQAVLKYSGAVGLVKDIASINVAGNLGTAAFNVTIGESLTAVANRVNQQTANTGVTATVVGSDLFFKSVGFGSSAEVFVEATSGTLSVSGGSALGNGRIDYGKDAEATINGVDYVGDGNRFRLELASGTFELEFAAGFQGDFDRFSAISASTEDTINVSGRNNSQVANFQVNSIDPGDFQTLAGEVREVAEKAQLKYSGDSGAVAKDAASINIAGSLGTASFTVADGESLVDVADRINQQSGATGVTASVVNNDLFLDSAEFGTSQSVFVKVVSGEFDVSGGSTYNGGEITYGQDVKVKIDGVDHFGDGNQLSFTRGTGSFTFEFAEGFIGDFDTITVEGTIGADNLIDGANTAARGVNRSQIAGFQVDGAVANSIQSVSGEVRELAETAQLKYSGSSGLIRDAGTFTLAGSLGTADFSVAKNESLSGVADRINQQSTATGVTATVVGNDLFLNSVDYGTDASVFVQVTSGKFDVSGGTSFNGGKIDYGKDVKAKFNGVEYIGDGNRVSFSDASGSFTVDFVPGFKDTFDTVTVGSFNQAFELDGGNGDGTANGVDAEADFNGQGLIANGNRFEFSDALGSYVLDVVPGFSGPLDPISITSSDSAYAIGGGNGDGTAVGSDAVVGEVVNPQPPADDDPPTPPVAVPVVAAPGTNRSATVGFSVVDRLRHIGSISLRLDVSTLGGSAGKLAQLTTGGGKSGLGAFAENAVSIAQQALTYVTNIESLLDQAAQRAVDSSSDAESAPTSQDIKHSLLAIRNSATRSSGGLIAQVRSDPRRVLDLLR